MVWNDTGMTFQWSVPLVCVSWSRHLNVVNAVLRLDWEVNRRCELLHRVLDLTSELVQRVSEVVITYLLDD